MYAYKQEKESVSSPARKPTTKKPPAQCGGFIHGVSIRGCSLLADWIIEPVPR
jgi:hypothetical protein